MSGTTLKEVTIQPEEVWQSQLTASQVSAKLQLKRPTGFERVQLKFHGVQQQSQLPIQIKKNPATLSSEKESISSSKRLLIILSSTGACLLALLVGVIGAAYRHRQHHPFTSPFRMTCVSGCSDNGNGHMSTSTPRCSVHSIDLTMANPAQSTGSLASEEYISAAEQIRLQIMDLLQPPPLQLRSISHWSNNRDEGSDVGTPVLDQQKYRTSGANASCDSVSCSSWQPPLTPTPSVVTMHMGEDSNFQGTKVEQQLR